MSTTKLPRLIIVMTLLIAVLSACGPAPATPTMPGLPNPAAVFCVDQGGRSEIRTAADGSQSGYCLFPDGSECEEWAYFRGECAPGAVAAPTP